jgi:hypothetical protein
MLPYLLLYLFCVIVAGLIFPFTNLYREAKGDIGFNVFWIIMSLCFPMLILVELCSNAYAIFGILSKKYLKLIGK